MALSMRRSVAVQRLEHTSTIDRERRVPNAVGRMSQTRGGRGGGWMLRPDRVATGTASSARSDRSHSRREKESAFTVLRHLLAQTLGGHFCSTSQQGQSSLPVVGLLMPSQSSIADAAADAVFATTNDVATIARAVGTVRPSTKKRATIRRSTRMGIVVTCHVPTINAQIRAKAGTLNLC